MHSMHLTDASQLTSIRIMSPEYVPFPLLTASARSMHFSPDAAALQSILLNEGVKVAGPIGTTPRHSVCPPGRGTSIYTVWPP